MKIRINYAGAQKWRLTFGKGWTRTRLARRLLVVVPLEGVFTRPAHGYRTRAFLECEGVLDLVGKTAIIRNERR